jgi:hypothetical protein
VYPLKFPVQQSICPDLKGVVEKLRQNGTDSSSQQVGKSASASKPPANGLENPSNRVTIRNDVHIKAEINSRIFCYLSFWPRCCFYRIGMDGVTTTECFVMPTKKIASHEMRTEGQCDDIDPVTLTWKLPDTTFNNGEIQHISQEKLLKFLSDSYALTVNERWHLRGCDRCVRLLGVLRKVRHRAAHTLPSPFEH